MDDESGESMELMEDVPLKRLGQQPTVTFPADEHHRFGPRNHILLSEWHMY